MQPTNKSTLAGDIEIPKKTWWQRLLALGLILLLFIAGLTVSKHLLKTKPQAKTKPPNKEHTVVQIIQTSPVTTPVVLHALGTVRPAQEIQLMAQVSGQVVSVHPNLLPGGTVHKGETLVQLDDRDYQITLKQKMQALAKAEADLLIEQGNQKVAKKEWDIINQLSVGIDPSSMNIALRKPHLLKTQSAVQTAKIDIEKAELDLSRTRITAPFDAVISEEYINVGSQLSSQAKIATLVSYAAFWAELSVPLDNLAWIALPSSTQQGSLVTVSSSLKNSFASRIISLLPGLETNGLMARLLIEIDDPMGLGQSDKVHPPLPLGSHIRAEIIGKKMTDVYQLPRFVVQNGNTILTVSEDLTLKSQPVSILWKSPDWFYINDGITPQTKIITSNIATPIEGMPLKIYKEQESKSKAPSPKGIKALATER